MGQRDRARIGRTVKRHLEANDDVLCFSQSGLDVYFYKDFIQVSERQLLKKLIKSDMTQSGTLGGSYPTFSDFRTSSTSHFAQGADVVQSVDERIASVIGLDKAFAESTQGQHYAVGQTFKPHCDFFHEVEPQWSRWRREGGQRTWTAMAYLDDDVDGGDTRFIKVDFKIKPVAGMLVLWNNMTHEGRPNFETMHEGAPIRGGEKTIITKWFRERHWQPRPPKEAGQAA